MARCTAARVYTSRCSLTRWNNKCRSCSKETCQEFGKYLQRIYNSIIIENNGEDVPIEIYVKNLVEGRLEGNPDSQDLNCTRKTVGAVDIGVLST